VTTARTVAEVRAAVAEAKGRGSDVGCVPTMGALHEGHLSLVRRARTECGFVVVSIFVNPTQFAAGEDLAKYPRSEARDLELAEAAGADMAFAPTVEEMYPPGAATTVHVSRLTELMCGAFRKGHFDGVTTVVAKLLSIVQPNRAYFGEKDYQQLQVVRRMVVDLNLPVEIVGCPTVREADGLAMSSRNAYLTPEERAAAPALHHALLSGAEIVRVGGSASEAEEAVRRALAGEPRFRLQYAEARRPETLERDEEPGPPMVVAAAAFLGNTRLIDNVIVPEGAR
jgi:pantoate--beta-alanine ligase